MNTETLSKKSREELNNSLLALYRKLTDKSDTSPQNEQVQPDSHNPKPDGDCPDQLDGHITPALGIGI